MIRAAEDGSRTEPADGTGGHKVVLLGPQALSVTVGDVMASLRLDHGPVATITAGWQEREPEDGELDRYLEGRSTALHLYARLERVFSQDKELADTHRRKQRELRDLRRFYNIRLSAAMDAVLALLKEKGDAELLGREQGLAIEALREVDQSHLRRIEEIWTEFLERYRPHERDAMAREREEVRAILEGCPAVVVTGGHVAVLLNRLRLFRMGDLLREKTIIAWSAGAMALSDQVVLFHDNPPQGPGHAEVFEYGLGLCSKIVPLPHGRLRLRLDDRARVARFARRFEPAACVIMDAGTRLDWDGRDWTAEDGAETLAVDGAVASLRRW